ncbi:protein-disulfide reductase DsbD family protein [Rhodopirellula sp. SWK7]|uniref:protein-disulfide reductase DsbD family protein n=1 Tax=Rhodopirellula sp. SWK7 TaxID=595460 RepID=UPI00034B5B94|nr:thioredoxin family protein [Rhodopirellula sp. SWK7]
MKNLKMTQSNLKRSPRQLTRTPVARWNLLRRAASLLTAFAVLAALSLPVYADDDGAAGLFPNLSLGRYGQTDVNSFGQEDPAQVDANFTSMEGRNDVVVLQVKVTLQEPWHIYSLTQPKGGPLPTRITLTSPESIELVGDWKSDREPKKSVSQEFGGLTIEEHDDEVTFFALAQLPKGQTPESLEQVEIEISALSCVSGGACQPLDETLTATFAGKTSPGLAAAVNGNSGSTTTLAAQVASDQSTVDASQIPLFQDDDYAISWRAYVTTPSIEPGAQGKLVFVAIPDSEYHIYPGVAGDKPMSTNFAITDKSGLRIAAPKTDSEIIKEEPIPGLVNEYHHGDVKWVMPFEIPADAKPGKKTIRGGIAYQACTAQNCLLPMALRFEAVVNVVASETANDATAAVATPIVLKTAKAKEIKTLAADADWIDKITPVTTSALAPQPAETAPESSPESGSSSAQSPAALAADSTNSGLKSATGSDAESDTKTLGVVSEDIEEETETATALPVILSLAFIGGIILNFMPCVLPVVGLKVMSFVQQAGSDRKRAFLLNFSYSAGIMAIYVVLAVLMVVFSMAWGEIFTHFEVRIGLIVLMFAMALSYFGFWELPAPGMASSKSAQDLQQREGYTGAFFKGMFATVLSTPCSGPFLGGIFALIGGRLPPLQSTLVILVVGIGMAIPYIIMGIWPRLMSWLPKPGPWMETFKEFLAFLFLATVAFFFYSFNDEDKLWVFITLIGVWFGCWIIGKVPSWQTLQKRALAWTSGIAAAVAISVLAFQFLGPMTEDQKAEQELIAWEPYNEVRLQELQAEGKTVLVDFSAKWCVNCLVNLKVAIDTKPTAELVKELDAVAMYADWTDRNPAIKAKLEELQSKSIPLLAIYPGQSPQQPILLRDLVSQKTVLDALRQAGPSQTTSVATRKSPRQVVTANR